MNTQAKKTANSVTAKTAITNDNDMSNIELMNKALGFFTGLVNTGKNALVLKQVAEAFTKQSDNSTTKALQLDGTLKGLESKAFTATSLTIARKIASNDNYADYLKMIKQVMSKNIELNDKQKDAVKKAVATAQVLRSGYLAKYVYGDIDFAQLQKHYRIEKIEVESVTDNPNADQAQASAENKATETTAINMQEFAEMVGTIQTEQDALLALELVQAQLNAIREMQQLQKSA